MARRARSSEEKQPANLTPDQMKAAIPKIERRIKDLREFDVDSISYRYDPRIAALEASIESTLASVIGPNTLDFDRYITTKYLDKAPITMGGATPIHEVRDGVKEGISRAIALLEQAVTGFREELEGSGQTESGRALRAF